MRTTLSIDDGLLERAKKRAAERGITLGRFVDDALRDHLSSESAPESVVRLTVFDGGGARPGIDLSSNRALLAAMEDDRYDEQVS